MLFPQITFLFHLLQNKSVEKAYFGEVRTVIVSGLWNETTNETLTRFFENGKRSGGGKIEKMERFEPDVAHITFESPEGFYCNIFRTAC